MKAYFDTNVLVPAVIQGHENSADCGRLLERAASRELEGFYSSQGLSELYSVLSRTPWAVPVTAMEALAIVEDMLPWLNIVDVPLTGYMAAVSHCARHGWRGGRVHDAVHIQAARQAECDVIFTYDTSDFLLLAPDWTGRILRPATGA